MFLWLGVSHKGLCLLSNIFFQNKHSTKLETSGLLQPLDCRQSNLGLYHDSVLSFQQRHGPELETGVEGGRQRGMGKGEIKKIVE